MSNYPFNCAGNLARGDHAGLQAIRDFARNTLGPWLTEADLTGIRDDDSLEKLPLEERTQWRLSWRDLDDMIAPLDRGRKLHGDPSTRN